MAAVLRLWRGRGSAGQRADVQIRSQRPGRDLRICVSDKVPGATEAAGLRPHFEHQEFREHSICLFSLIYR